MMFYGLLFFCFCWFLLSVWYVGFHEGKRAAEEVVEKQVVAKKLKRDEGVEQAVQKQKIEAKTQKKVETSSSEDDSSSEEETVNGILWTRFLLLFVKGP